MADDLLHGGALDRVRRDFPDAPAPWVDLSTGINPWPWPAPAPSPESLRRLPPRSAFEACSEAMATAFGAPREAVLPVPGTELVIRLLPLVLDARRVAALAPSYADHARAWRAHGRAVLETARPLERAGSADVVVVTSPNNPDGRRFGVDALEAARATLAARGGTLVVDEAYADLDPTAGASRLAGRPGLVVLRSAGKFFGLAGLRLGAVLAPRAALERLASLLGVWSVSGPALELGTAAYRDARWQAATRSRLRSARASLDAALAGTGAEIVGGTDLYRFVAVRDASAAWRALAGRGVYVRRFDWSGTRLRLGLPPDAAARERLRAALVGALAPDGASASLDRPTAPGRARP